MSAISLPVPTLAPGVQDFLIKHEAEKAFRQICDLVHESFPEVIQIRADLQDDPDEEGRRSVILYATLPSSHPLDLIQSQRRNYHEQLVGKVPLSLCPLFGLILRFAES
jgi:hypothetical protein